MAEAVKISSDHVAKLEAKLDETSRQIVEIKIMLARMQPKGQLSPCPATPATAATMPNP